jgi:hypothetical protein
MTRNIVQFRELLLVLGMSPPTLAWTVSGRYAAAPWRRLGSFGKAGEPGMIIAR